MLLKTGLLVKKIETDLHVCDSLFSDFVCIIFSGGTLGLFIGVSVMTLMELIMWPIQSFLTKIFQGAPRRRFGTGTEK
jgi:hypothetical protein